MSVYDELKDVMSPWLDDPNSVEVSPGGGSGPKRTRKKSAADGAVVAALPTSTAAGALDDEDSYPTIQDGAYAIPFESVAYIARGLEGKTDVETCREARRQGIPVFLYGPPGTGKTKCFQAAFGERLLTVMGTSDTEVSDFVGQWTQDANGDFVWVDGPLVIAMVEGRPLLVDEIGLVDPKVLSVLYSAMDGRGEVYVTANPTRGTVKAAPGFYVVAATNPHAPGVRVSEALISRFLLSWEVTTDYKLATELGVPKSFVQAASNMDTQRINGETTWSPQMRELLAAKQINDLFGADFAARNMLAAAPEDAREDLADALTKSLGRPVTIAALAADGR